MIIDQVIEKAKEDAKTGNYNPDAFDDSFKNGSQRMVYVRAYLAAREKMGMLGIVGLGMKVNPADIVVKKGVLKLFYELAIGDTFFERSHNSGYNAVHYGPMQEKTYRKISKSKATLISITGAGAYSGVGETSSFGPSRAVLIS